MPDVSGNTIPLAQAMAKLDRDHTWRRFKLDYPEVSFGHFAITRFDIPHDDEKRREIVRREGMDRDPGYGQGFCKLIEYPTPECAAARQNGKVFWMSDTKAEIVEHYPLFNAIREHQAKRIIINGLGLGMAVHGALQFPWVEHIDIVEVNQEIVDGIRSLIGDKRVRYHVDDAFSMKFPSADNWDLAWHDIWPKIDDLNVPQMERLRRKYKWRTRWQGCWQEDGCRAMADAMRRAKNGTMTPDEAFGILVEGRWPFK